MTFSSIRLEGTILSSDLLDSIERGDKNGQEPRDFGFESGTKVKDEIASTWATAKALWTAYQSRLSNLREGSTGTTETRNLFVLPLFSLLGYSPELTEAETLNGKSYAISHRDKTCDAFPFQIVGPFAPDATIPPDRSTLDLKIKGQARMSPHALVQEYINLTEHLYGIVTNGHKLRLLRDSTRLIKLSFLEFDFERMFGEELFADFALLYRLLHASRMPANRQEASRSLIERYHQDSLESGSRIRDGLASAVAFAMQTIATGLLAHEKNDELRATVAADPDHAQILHQNLLRWLYRTLFLLVIEERGLHHYPDATLRQRRIYQDYYSLQRLRRLADRPQLADRRHSDLWGSMHQTLRLFEDCGKGSPLGIAPLGSFLFRGEGLKSLFQYQLDNSTLLKAINRLSIFQHPDTKNYMRVNYAALDVEEFGSIYESLLELRPRIIPDGEKSTFHYAQLAGNERKTTGSYYTPDSLVQQLISTALDPVLEKRLTDAKTPAEKEIALLSLKVCDPAVGSGHFLIAAAHRLSRRLAEIRAGDEALSLHVQRHALRDVVSHCLYGVDINPLSVELCKVSLWMLAMEPGKPLSFLDHHVQCGNALLGATPEALAKGLPDDAFKPIEGDDKEYCAKFKKANKEEAKLRKQVGDLFDRENKPWERLGNVPAAIAKLDTLPDDTPEAVRKKAETYENAIRSADYLNARFLHDAWCAAFVWRKCEPDEGGFAYPITNGELTKIERNPHNCPPWMREETQRLANEFQFFHWHLGFPEVFANGGFDIILGNPPWEEIRPEEKKYFTADHPDIGLIDNRAKRGKAIASLETNNPQAWNAWQWYRRILLGSAHFIHTSNQFPLSSKGNLSSATLFVDLTRRLLNESAAAGLVVPSGLATNEGTGPLFQDIMAKHNLESFFEFENRSKFFPNVDGRARFSLVTLASTAQREPMFGFLLGTINDLAEPDRLFSLKYSDLAAVNPNSCTCPTFKSRQSATLVASIHRRWPILSHETLENDWEATSSRMFDMSYSAALFQDEEFDDSLPLYEGKMITQFNHRFASVVINAQNPDRPANSETISITCLHDPYFRPTPRYWIARQDLEKKLGNNSTKPWLIQFCKITSPTNERTAILSVTPRAPAGDSLHQVYSPAGAIEQAALVGMLNSFCVDFVLREKMGGINLNHFVFRQLPVINRKTINSHNRQELRGGSLLWICSAIVELTYTAWDQEPFAVACGYDGPPFKWDEDRRFQLRCELDAIFFHLYLPCDESGAWKSARIAEGAVRDETETELAAIKSYFPTPRHAVAYIMDTFPIVRKKDIKATTELDASGSVIKKGSYLTKIRILDLYDQMLVSRREGKGWKSPLAITPASFRATHPPRLPDAITRTVYTEDEKLWLHFIRQFLLQARHEANLGLLVETWNLFSCPTNLIEQRTDTLASEELLSWKKTTLSAVPKRGFHDFVAGLHASGLIQVDRLTHQIALPEESSIRKLDKDEWINYEVSQALAILADRVDITSLLSGESELPEVIEILSYFAA